MATRTTITLEDDINGGPAQETLQFRLGTAEYEIDLNAQNARRFRTQMAPFIDHARKTGRRQRRSPMRARDRRDNGGVVSGRRVLTGLVRRADSATTGIGPVVSWLHRDE